MTHNTMEKRLRRKFNISPREARLALRKCDYDYEVAAGYVELLKCGLTIEELSNGIEAFTKTAIRDEGGAANEDRNGNTTT